MVCGRTKAFKSMRKADSPRQLEVNITILDGKRFNYEKWQCIIIDVAVLFNGSTSKR